MIPVWEAMFSAALADLEAEQLLRQRRIVRRLDATHVEVNGKICTNFSSNDYLGLTHHPRLIEAASEALRQDGTASGAAALLGGYGPRHAHAEQSLAAWKKTEAALLFPSGYVANLAAIHTIASISAKQSKQVRFIIDKLAHASLIDAVRTSGAVFRVYPHNHLEKLERLLSEATPGVLQVVVTESIFSMDGDAAPLQSLAELRERYGFLLMLDEAHASGIYGPSGEGLAVESGVHRQVDLFVVTLSKALGGMGGVVCGSRALCEAIVNTARSFIFTTNLPAHLATVAAAAVMVVREEPSRRQRLRERAAYLRRLLNEHNVRTIEADSPIVPIVIGGASATLALANRLLGEGMFVSAVRPPSVPRGGSRLRLTVSSEHSEMQIRSLVTALAGALPDLSGP